MYDDYEPVAERLAKWWADWPDGRISTSYEFDGRAWVFKAELYRDKNDVGAMTLGDVSHPGTPAATGYARQELLEEPPKVRCAHKKNNRRADGCRECGGQGTKLNWSAPEWTSPVEVCETSAIGRALANLGYAAKRDDATRASKEEMDRQQRNQDLTRETKQQIRKMVGGDTDKAKALWAASVDDPEVRIHSKTTQAAVLQEAERIYKESQ